MPDGSDLDRPLRVVQWATGNIGGRSLRAVIDHPSLELVGVYAYGESKIGVDAGSLCDRSPTGVLATNRIDEILALGADCVLYMPNANDADEVCSLLAAGANVVTTRGEYHHPASIERSLRHRVEGACRAGGASIHSTGSSPGFITEAVPLVLTSIQRRLDRLAINEYADLSRRPSPDLLFRVMGYGREPSAFDPRRLQHGLHSFGPSLRLTAEALGIALDDIQASGEFGVTRGDLEIAAGTIPAGTVAAQRIRVSGLRDGRERISFTANWYCTTAIERDNWDLQPTGWRVQVEGDTPLDVTLRFPFPIEDMANFSPGYTAHRAVNAVHAVCAAEPGIRTSVELPHIIARLG